MSTLSRKKTVRVLSDGSTATYEHWRGSWTDRHGTRRSVTLGNCDVVSETQAKRVFDERIQDNTLPTAAAISVRQYLDLVIPVMTVQRDEGTRKDYERTADQLCEVWGEATRLRSIDAAAVDRFMAAVHAQNLGAHTIRRRFVLAKAMMSRATKTPSRRRPYLTFNPFDDREPPDKGEPSEFRYVSPAESWKFIETCPDPNWLTMFTLTRLCAMRASEALAVAPGDVAWNEPDPYVQVRIRKNRAGKGGGTKQRFRMVPLSPAAESILLWRFGQLEPGAETMVGRLATRRSKTHPSDLMRVWLERAGIHDSVKPFHDLRKSQAHDWAVLYGTENSADWCGHSISVAIKNYRREKRENLSLVTKRSDPKANLISQYNDLDRRVAERFGCGQGTLVHI